MAKRRSTDNTMAKRQKTKGQTFMYKPLHRKQTIEQHTTPPKTGGKLSAPDREAVFGTYGNRHVTPVTHPGESHECGKDRIVITTNGTYPCAIMPQIFYNG